MTRSLLVATLIAGHVAVAAAGAQETAPAVPRPDLSRAGQVAEAVVIGTHACEVRLARAAGMGAQGCWTAQALTDGDLAALVAHQEGLFASNHLALRAWIDGRDAARFDPARDLYPLLSASLPLDPRLPVNVFTARVARRSRASAAEVRSVASLYQLILEIDRDGDVLQDALAFLIELGMPVYVGQLGLRGDDGSHAALGAELAASTCTAPFATDAAAWRDAGRKVWNWGEKHLGIRDATVVAAELAHRPDVRAAVGRLRASPPSRVAVVGHSFTMGNHWASPGSFTTIAAAVLARAHVPIETRHYSAGGLTATRAWRTFGREVLEWHPDAALVAVAVRTDEDLTALGTLITALRREGTQVLLFDELGDPTERDAAMAARRIDAARTAGARVIPVARRLAASPARTRFLSLDGIHMTEPYHRLMAVAWLEALADATVPPAGHATPVAR